MFKRILIANRGEIACRIAATCRRLGVQTVAVYSEADATSRHVAEADRAVLIGPARPAASYLNREAIIGAAKASGAEAVHPGYGFMSEDPRFARACTEAGLTFVGPSPESMEKVGSKADAKAAMEACGVPVVPGYHGADQSPETLTAMAAETGFPLLIKAAAGGGGKGMRIVRSAAEFDQALAAARREAANAFGDDRVILERYLERPRHLEVQVFGDQHGNIVHLFERDCSAQRRHQKIIEESPAPGLSLAQREALWAAGVAAAAAVDYHNAGTVEFIAEPSGEFYFMEMNTRLQVEHPVTEALTGIDLVEWQLRVAAGEPLPLGQADIHASGHAVEARVYAEDPSGGFLPSSGVIDWLRFPSGVRVDTGVRQGDEVSSHYDPMIAKIISHAPRRGSALAALTAAVTRTAIGGPRTNLDLLARLLVGEPFARGEVHTAYLDRHLEQILPAGAPNPALLLAATVCILLIQERQAQSMQQASADPYSPWAIADGWRLGHFGRRVISLVYRGEHYRVDAHGWGGDYGLVFAGDSHGVTGGQLNDDCLLWNLDGLGLRTVAAHSMPYVQISDGGQVLTLRAEDPFAVSLSGPTADNRILAPMPGRIVALRSAAGDRVTAGDEVMVMEAMKMELSLSAPISGLIAMLGAGEGDFVEADTLLVELAPDPAADEGAEQ